MTSRSPTLPRQSEQQPTESTLPQPIETLRKKNAIPMVVPGGSSYKPINSGGLQGQRIDKGDQIVKIDSKEVTTDKMILLLRDRDLGGSPVTVEIQKVSEQEPRTFTIHRVDIRHKSRFAS